jgi:hypothetical protein
MVGWFQKRGFFRRRHADACPKLAVGQGLERLEGRAMMAAAQLSTVEVESLLQRASAATPSTNAIIAIVDRSGEILGVRTESDFAAMSNESLSFAIDGAVAAAFGRSDVQNISLRFGGVKALTDISFNVREHVHCSVHDAHRLFQHCRLHGGA